MSSKGEIRDAWLAALDFLKPKNKSRTAVIKDAGLPPATLSQIASDDEKYAGVTGSDAYRQQVAESLGYDIIDFLSIGKAVLNGNPPSIGTDPPSSSEVPYDQVFGCIGDGAWVIDAEDKIIEVSKSAVYLYRSTREELMRLELDIPNKSYLHQKYETKNQLILTRGDGTQVTIWRQCFPLIDSKGDYIGALVTDRDITEQVRVENALRQSELTLRHILDLVPDMIFAKDYNGRFLLANQAVADTFGMPPKELVGRRHMDEAADKTEASQMLSDDRQVIDTQQPLFIPVEQYTDVHGNVHWLQTTKVPFSYEGKKAVLVCAVDITGRKKAENALQAAYNELEATATARARELEEIKEG